MNNVWAIGGTSGEGGTEYGDGDDSWNEAAYSALKITIIDKSGSKLGSKIFLNSYGIPSGTMFSDNITSKNNQSPNINWISYDRNDSIFYSGYIDINLYIELNKTSLIQYLEDSDYANLKDMIEEIDHSSSNAKYIVVEPMIVFPTKTGKLYGTLYEYSNYLLNSDGSLITDRTTVTSYDYKLVFQNVANSLWAQTKNQNLFETETQKFDRHNDFKADNLKSKTYGYGVGIYYYDDIVKRKGKITIKKYGTGVSETKLLKGANFQIYKVLENGEKQLYDRTTYTTGSTGMVSIPDLEFGTYAIKETKAPLGYEIDYEKYPDGWINEAIVLDSSHKTQSVSVYNKEITGKITIKKTDQNGKTLYGYTARFNIYKGKGCTGQLLYNNFSVNGERTIPDDLALGDYSIKETYFSDTKNYKMNNTCHNVTLTESNATQQITVKNEQVIEIQKRDIVSGNIINQYVSFDIYDNSQCADYINIYSRGENYNYVSHCDVPVYKDGKQTGTTRGCYYNDRHRTYYKDNYNHKLGTISFRGKKTNYVLPISKTGSYYVRETSFPLGYYKPSQIYATQLTCTSSWCRDDCGRNSSCDSSWRYTTLSPNNCVPLNISGGTAIIYNKNECADIYRDIDPNSMDQRIWAYRYLKRYHNLDYRGMLVLGNDEAHSCAKVDNSPKTTTSCLEGKYEDKRFDATDLSLYNHTIAFTTLDGKQGIAYCRTSFKLNINKNLNGPTWTVKSGQMPIQKLQKLDAIATVGTLEQRCYKYVLPDDDSVKPTDEASESIEGSDIPAPKYDKYVSNINLDEKKLFYGDLATTKNARGAFQTYTLTANYYLNEVYSKIGTGEISYNKSKNYKSIGYGVISKFSEKKPYNIPYSLKLGTSFPLPSKQKEYSSTKCIVDPTQEIITTDDDPKKPDKLELEFRIIDTSNPFPGKRGNNIRLVGTNWRSKENLYDSNTLINKINVGMMSTDDFEYDINKDGKLDDKDLDYFNWVNNDWKKSKLYQNKSAQALTNKYSFNSYIAYIMETTNNSYNKNKETKPKYTIKLTPSDIKKIRAYNKNKQYDDFTLNCDSNAENCKMSDDFKKLISIDGI